MPDKYDFAIRLSCLAVKVLNKIFITKFDLFIKISILFVCDVFMEFEMEKEIVIHSEQDLQANQSRDLLPVLYSQVEKKIVIVRNMPVILDADVAALYGVETKRVNEAIKNNPDKFPEDYMFALTNEDLQDLRSKISTANVSSKSRSLPKAFTEKGLYMLATILKSKRATKVTFAIIETFAKVRNLKRELVSFHKEKDKQKQNDKMRCFGEVLSDIVMPDLETSETESTLELNFIIGKIKHSVKRVRKKQN